jgi:hypothetical protein
MTFKYRDLRQYKYQLEAPYEYKLDLSRFPVTNATPNDYIHFHANVMVLSAGYAWDGPSGPTIDTKTFMRGSLIHDALYQLLRERVVRVEHLHEARQYADELLREICLEDGMNRFRAWYVFWAVRYFGWQFANR